MADGHVTFGYLERTTWLHQVDARLKILITFLFVVTVVATPRGVWWPFALAGLLLVLVAATARIPAGHIGRRMLIEIPFILFAFLLPFFSTGPRIEFLGMTMSEPGLVSAGALLAKATIGVGAAVLLASTTAPAAMIRGLQRLGMPALLVQIMAFMLRYLSVVIDDLRRMRIARDSRCFAGSHLGQVRIVASSAGALFIRTFERGERVHTAMLARGYDGVMPQQHDPSARPASTAAGLVIGLLVMIVAVTLAWVLR